MKIILITGFILILISWLKRDKYTPYLGFAFVFLIMGFQSNVSGDFYTYMETFIHTQISGNANTRTIENEPFYPFLMKLFRFGPWWLFVALTSLFQTCVIAKFVDKYSNQKYKWVSAIFFFFTFNMMLLQMKAMRQALSIEMMLLAFMLLDFEIGEKGKHKHIPWMSLFLAALAFLTHNTSLFMMPILFLFWSAIRNPKGLERLGNSKAFPWIMVGVYFVIYVSKELFFRHYLESWALNLLSNTNSNYMTYFDGTSNQSFQNFDISTTPLYYTIFYGSIIYFTSIVYQKNDARLRVFCLITLISATSEMLFFSMGSLMRIVMGFSVFYLVVIPYILSYIHRRFGRAFAFGYLILSLIMVMKVTVPWMVQTVDDRFGTYKFVFMN